MAAKKKVPTRKTKAETQQARIELGADAKHLLDNPLLRTTLEHLKEDRLQAVIQADTPEKTWANKQLYTLTTVFEMYLEGYIMAGRDAMLMMEKDQLLLERQTQQSDRLSFEEFRKLASEARIAYENEHGSPQ